MQNTFCLVVDQKTREREREREREGKKFSVF